MRRDSEATRTGTAARARAALLLSLAIGACGPAAKIGPEPNEPGTAPDDQGAAQHRAAADLEAARLERHKELYDPHAQQSIKRCDRDATHEYPATPICWVETMNPTAVHLQEVEQHRLRAVQHRQAARALHDVEVRSCAGVADEDRDISPFSHQGDILGVTPLQAAGTQPNQAQLVGATILFRLVPRLTADELQRIIDCHLARNAVIGHDVAAAEMAECPLTERGARALVRPLRGGFAVDVRADDPATAQAIWRRAQALASVK